MSKLVDKLEKAASGEGAAVGFGAAGRREKTPSLLLVAPVVTPDTQSVARLIEEGADGVLLSEASAESLGALAETIGSVAWGVRLENPESEMVQKLKEKGCDFFILDSETTPLSLMAPDGPAMVLRITTSLSDALLRTIDLLPVDAVLVEGDGGGSLPLTMRGVWETLRLRALVPKPMMALVTSEVGAEELQILREARVEGIVLADIPSPERVRELHQLIMELKPPRKKASRRREVFLPFGREATPAAGEEEDSRRGF